jgi:hypothetical protein
MDQGKYDHPSPLSWVKLPTPPCGVEGYHEAIGALDVGPVTAGGDEG